MFKKVIYLGLMAGAIHFADAQEKRWMQVQKE